MDRLQRRLRLRHHVQQRPRAPGRQREQDERLRRSGRQRHRRRRLQHQDESAQREPERFHLPALSDRDGGCAEQPGVEARQPVAQRDEICDCESEPVAGFHQGGLHLEGCKLKTAWRTL